MEHNESQSSEPVRTNPLIDKFEEEYRSALSTVEGEVKSLMKSGRETAALFLFLEQVQRVKRVHEGLTILYSLFYKLQPVLQHYKSVRLKQVGHELMMPIPTEQTDGTVEPAIALALQAIYGKYGVKPVEHWYFSAILVTQVEYMIETLKILVEPGFVPLDASRSLDEESCSPDRYIPTSVKLTVWRRDCGKCVECGSNERLEYDHIIPVAKGGSNTERNVQLLCETCNRKKSANIQ